MSPRATNGSRSSPRAGGQPSAALKAANATFTGERTHVRHAAVFEHALANVRKRARVVQPRRLRCDGRRIAPARRHLLCRAVAASGARAGTATARSQRLERRSLGREPGAGVRRAPRAETFYPMPVGEPAGRAIEADAVPIAVELARELKRPVQVVLSQSESQNHDRVAPGALARMTALARRRRNHRRVGDARRDRRRARLGAGAAERRGPAPRSSDEARSTARSALCHPQRPDRRPCHADLPFRAGYMRGSPQRELAFFTESFIDELARCAPGWSRWRSEWRCSARMGGWRAACRARPGARNGTAAAPEARWGSPAARPSDRTSRWSPSASIGADQRIKVDRLVAAVDCGRVVNSRPGRAADRRRADLGAGAGDRAPRPNGSPECREHGRSAASGLPRLGDVPQIVVEIIPSSDLAGRGQRARHHRCSHRPSPTRSTPAPASGCARCRSTRWRRHERPGDHPDRAIGVLLINLGTPDAPEARAVRRYLAEFLSDPRVIEIPQLAWKPILHGIILSTRPRKSAEAYNQVWTNEGSPLRGHRAAPGARRFASDCRTRQRPLCDALRPSRDRRGDRATWSRRAARESSPRRSTRNIARRRRRPPTTRSSRCWRGCACQPAMRTLPPYYDDPLYIDALAGNLARQLAALDFEPRAAAAELPRHAACGRASSATPITAIARRPRACCRKRLGAKSMSRSSRTSGARKWLEPATDATLAGLPGEGRAPNRRRRAGLLRRLHRDAGRAGDSRTPIFLHAGGEQFALLDCLNDSPESIAMLERLLAPRA